MVNTSSGDFLNTSCNRSVGSVEPFAGSHGRGEARPSSYSLAGEASTPPSSLVSCKERIYEQDFALG
jgi:hypothetical protein